MRNRIALLVILGGGSTALAAGCAEPPRLGQMEAAVSGLADLHAWDAVMQARGQPSYDAVIRSGPEILPVLVAHLTDMNPTALYDPISGRNPPVGDVCFLILLSLTGIPAKDLMEDGVYLQTVLPNPVFSVHWKDSGARIRVQARFREILPLD